MYSSTDNDFMDMTSFPTYSKVTCKNICKPVESCKWARFPSRNAD